MALPGGPAASSRQYWVFRQGAASKATGVPVTTHTYAADRIGEKQADIFESEGLSPDRVCLGHCDDTNDMTYLTGLLERGYTTCLTIARRSPT